MGKIYCISGLGADHRIFQRLHISGYELVPLPWVTYSKDDTLRSYAHKMAASIDDKEPIIIGVSFGGMLATEIAKQQKIKKVFIVSSAKSRAELGDPGIFIRFIITSGLIPAKSFTIPNRFIIDRFGAKTPDEQKMVGDILRDSDGHFMKWALKALTTWEEDGLPTNVTHIHGTADKIIPAVNVQPDFWIEGGTHIMVYNRADEIGKIVDKCLSI